MVQIKKLILDALPTGLRNQIRGQGKKFFKNKILKDWENKGKPVPPPHEVKQVTIEAYQKSFNCTTMVETGTYLGDMIFAMKDNFAKLYSIELEPTLWKNAVKRFSNNKHIEILQGDSGKVLHELVPKLNSKALFWLDGHYSAGVTAKGEKYCPIYEELDAIFNGNNHKHVLLIDDARHFNGKSDYPTIEELKQYVKTKNPQYKVEVKDDLIRITE